MSDAAKRTWRWARWGATLLLLLTSTWVIGTAAHHEQAFLRRALRADGLVVRHNPGKHHVEVRFKDEQGRVFQHHQNGLISYEIGRRVTVLYLPLPASAPIVSPTPLSSTLQLQPGDPLANLIDPAVNVHWVRGNDTVTTDAKGNLWGLTLSATFITFLLFGAIWNEQEGRMGRVGTAVFFASLMVPGLLMFGQWVGWIGG